MLLSSSSKPANMGFYLYGTAIPVAVSLYYNTSTKIADYGNRYFKKLMRYIMYYSGNKATAIGSHTFKVWYKDTPTYATGNVRIKKVLSTGSSSTYTLTTSGSMYLSGRSEDISLADGEYFTIDGMNDTSESGPTTSVSQTITVYISPTSSVGSYLDTTNNPTAPSCSIFATVTSKKHLAQAYLYISFNTSMCSYLTVYYNSTSRQISSSGNYYYFDPNVTSIATYTHSNLSISRKFCARAYITIGGLSTNTTYGNYTYKGVNSTGTWNEYLADVTATCSIGDTYGKAYTVFANYETSTIIAPTIKTCTDAGS